MDNKTPLQGELRSVSVAELEPNPWNRIVFHADALKELEMSVSAVGVREPLAVRPLPNTEPPRFQIVSGERRWRVAQKLGIATLPCVVQDFSDAEVQDMNLVANMAREEVPVLEKGRMLKARLADGNLTQEQLAKALGIERSWVTRLVSLMDLPAAVLHALRELPLSARALLAIRSLPAEAMQLQIAKELHSGTVALEKAETRTRELSAHFHAGKSSDAPKEDHDPFALHWTKAKARTPPSVKWNVTYKGEGRWMLEVKLAEPDAKTLDDWFHAAAPTPLPTVTAKPFAFFKEGDQVLGAFRAPVSTGSVTLSEELMKAYDDWKAKQL